MVQTIVIGIAAGVAAALLLASFWSGSPLSLILINLTPLPLMIAALGWSHVAGLIAAFVAAAALAVVFDGLLFIAFLVGIGLPAWWLSYLALLARPAGSAAPGGVDWYPVGRLVVWAALLGTLIVLSAVASSGLDVVGFRAGLRVAIEHIWRIMKVTPAGTPAELTGVADSRQFVDLLVVAIPPITAALSTATGLGNLWLAARVARVSGRLRRPWPDIPAMALPHLAAVALCAAICATVLPELMSSTPTLTGLLAGVLTASLLMAYAIVGFAVLHAVTRRIRGRVLVLAGIYAAVAVFKWPVLVMTIVGLADAALDIRGRVATRRGPPAIHP